LLPTCRTPPDSANKAVTFGAFSFATNRSFGMSQRPDWNRSQENPLFPNRGDIHPKNIDKAAQGGQMLQKVGTHIQATVVVWRLTTGDTIKWPDVITTLKILI
jgi:hypothetical protein